jgi:GT2 family glycosyltransferase
MDVPRPPGRVTVVVATRDRRDDLLRTLARLERLPERPPVVVVDDGSRDGTPAAVARAYPQVRILEPGGGGGGVGAAARTAGVLAAATPYVAFCDDDSWWEPGALARAAELLDGHPDVALLAARVLLAGGRPDPTCAAMAVSPLPSRAGLPGPRVLGFIACAAVVRRDAYLAAGGFHPRWGVGGEEGPLAAALADRGWALVYVPELVAQHRPSPRRDTGRRRGVATRNDLWSAWTLRPARDAVRVTGAQLAAAAGDPRRAAGALAAARAAPWALRHRRPVGPRVAAELALLDRATSGRRSGPRGRSRRPASP